MIHADREQIWRGQPFSLLEKEAATIPKLKKVIEMYSGTATDLKIKKDLVLEAMRVLDNYRPPLSNEDAHSAIRFQKAPHEIGESARNEEPTTSTERPIATSVATQTLFSNEQPAEGRPSESLDVPSVKPSLESSIEPSLEPSIESLLGPLIDVPANSEKSIVNGQATGGQAQNANTSTSNSIQRAKKSRRFHTQPFVEGFVIISPSSVPPSTLEDTLRRAVRRSILQTTNASLQPMEGHSLLLPVENQAAIKVIVHKNAFEYLFDDKTNPGIHSIQIEIPPGDIPYKHRILISRVGYALPYRGCGPVWDQNSCHVDCCIVAGRLMSVGQVQADRLSTSEGNKPKESLDFQINFRDFAALPWETYKKATSVAYRHAFLRNYFVRRDQLEKCGRWGQMLAANDSWQVCAAGFGQFEYAYYLQTTCDKCSKVTPKPTNIPKTGVLEFDAPTMAYWKFTERDDITQLFNKHFSPKPFKNCAKPGCRGQTFRTRIIEGELPERLVIPTPSIPSTKADRSPILKDRDILGATSNRITVTYQSTTGQKIAHYRWLGGIYKFELHFRLYWSDRVAGDGDNLMVYDGMRQNGSIIGGVPQYSPYNAVPPPWSQGCDVLFYERVYPEEAQIKANRIRAMVDEILNQEQPLGIKRGNSEIAGESNESSKGTQEQDGPRKKRSPSPKK